MDLKIVNKCGEKYASPVESGYHFLCYRDLTEYQSRYLMEEK